MSEKFEFSETPDEFQNRKHEELVRRGIEIINPPKKHLDILMDPFLFDKIVINELNKKIVGEVSARKVIFLCGVGGRLVTNSQIASFNLLVNDEAGKGKDYVVRNTLSVLPKEFYFHKTRISPTAFTYWHNSKFEPSWSWDGKVLYLEDISEQVLNSDVFKVMSSHGSSATIVIRQQAHEIDIIGKPVLIITTANASPNPELTRRFVILFLDSSKDQTKEIMKRHSEFKREGIIPEIDSSITEALRFLKRVKVVIPFSDEIYENFPTNHIFMRTNYPRFLDFVSASASLYQYQRKKNSDGSVIADISDYNRARECFLTLFSNKEMIALTKNHQKILSVFEKDKNLKLTVTQLMPFLKGQIAHIFTAQKRLRELVGYGFLEESIGEDKYGRDVEMFSKSQKEVFGLEIPELIEVSETDEVNEVNEVSETSTTNDRDTSLNSLTSLNKCFNCGSDDAFILINNKIFCEGCSKNES